LPRQGGNQLEYGREADSAVPFPGNGGFVRIFLGFLIALSLIGALDSYRSAPAFFLVALLGGACWVLASRVGVLERRLRELEDRSGTAWRDRDAHVESAWETAPGEFAGKDAEFAFSEEVSPGSPSEAREDAGRKGPGRVRGADVRARPVEDSRVERPEGRSESLAARARAAASAVWGWFTGGNPLVKVGLVVLFFGVSFLLKYAADHSLLPVELRMAGAGLLGVAMLALGWRLRRGRPVYALLVQGGGVGVLYLTIFAAARYVGMLPPLAALVLMTAVVVFSGVLAVAQDAMALALFGALGGFLAPLLLSTGQGSHVHLFGYYALLNLGVLGIALRRAWRPLNLLGFACTFGIGAFWGATYYTPAHFSTIQPFLILFFVMYGVVSMLFASARRESPRLDSALVFGLPLAAFGLQVGLVRDTELGGAFSCLVLVAWYIATLVVLRRAARRREEGQGAGLRLLSEAHLALAVIFVSMAVPMALDGTWTASTWALEGAGMIWLGLRQRRLITRVFGVLLQLGAAVAFWMSLDHAAALDNGQLLAGLFLGAGGLVSGWCWWAFSEACLRQEKYLARAAALWGAVWWYGALFFRFVPADEPVLLAALTVSTGVWFLLQLRTSWPVPGHLVQATPFLMIPVALEWNRHPGADTGWLAWPMALVVLFAAMRRLEAAWSEKAAGLAHSASGVLAALLAGREVHWLVRHHLGSGTWAGAATAATGVLVLLAFSAAPLEWPLRRHRAAYVRAGAVPAIFLVLWWLAASSNQGDPRPLPYVPVLNPLDLAQALVVAALAFWARSAHRLGVTGRVFAGGGDTVLLALGGFAWINVALGRAVHFLAGVHHSFDALFRSEVMQASCSVLWSVTALAAMLAGRRRGSRRAWLAGAGLLGVVVVKLFLIDLEGSGTVARIVSFLGVGLLMLVMGYFCPLPPKEDS
jgi:uncharacterized membrane protein